MESRLRRDAGETLLCVANLALTARASTLRLPPELAGATLPDVFGGAKFPGVGADGTATFTLGSRDFYWLAVTTA